MKKTLLASAIITSMLPTLATAEKASKAELYLGAGHYFWDSDRNLDDATSIEGGIEVPLDTNLSMEAWINNFEADAESGTGELDGNRYSYGALYHLMEGDYRPFVSGGVGHMELEPEGSDENDETLLYLGLGAKKYFDNNFILRGEALAMNSLDYEVTDFGIRVALGYAFGRSSTPVSMAESAPTERAEPTATPTPAAAPDKTMAKEPMTPPVRIDSDNDGVYDDMDQCPKTEATFKVDEKGCPVKLVETVSINLAVQFKTGSSQVTGSEEEIKELAAFLNKFKDSNVTVEGHTDDRGSAKLNQELSQNRAEAVKQKLINDYGIETSRVTAKGYGEDKPVASNDTAEGRAQNRRVVAQVSASEEKVQTK